MKMKLPIVLVIKILQSCFPAVCVIIAFVLIILPTNTLPRKQMTKQNTLGVVSANDNVDAVMYELENLPCGCKST
jgi:hypothetical protein